MKNKSRALTILAAMSLTVFTFTEQASAITTFDLGDGAFLGLISGTNDPAPGALVCSAAGDVCNTKNSGNQGTYVGTFDINSANIGKINEPDTSSSTPLGDFSLTVDTGGQTGTWEQVWAEGDLVTHYIAVKASTGFNVIGFDISSVIGFISAGDKITGNWFTGSATDHGQHSWSHVSFYNSVSAVPLPGAAALLLTGLAGFGLFGRFKRKAAA